MDLIVLIFCPAGFLFPCDGSAANIRPATGPAGASSPKIARGYRFGAIFLNRKGALTDRRKSRPVRLTNQDEVQWQSVRKLSLLDRRVG